MTRNSGQFQRGHKAAQKGDEPRTAIIHMRVTREQKSAFKRAAKAAESRSLTDWLIEAGQEKIERDQDENARQKGQYETVNNDEST